MGLLMTSAMDWWEDWKLRVLVLCSFSVQFFLFFSADVRNWYVLRRLRIMVWVAYVGSDALAIYALAILFNRRKQQQQWDDALEVIWAPVLLNHLGGQLFISAYSLEDNELWKRHAITLVSQVAVALYVFCKWWSGERRLLQVAILLFVVGIFRFSQKPWALRRASFRTMAAAAAARSSESPTNTRSSSPWCSLLASCLQPTHERQEADESFAKEQVSCRSLEEYVQKARQLVLDKNNAVGGGDDDKARQQQAELSKDEGRHVQYIYKMFLDLPSPHSIRLHYLQYLLRFNDRYAHKLLRLRIVHQFFTIYTRQRSAATCLAGCCLIFVLPCLALASLILFATSGKDGYDRRDVTVTYVLFAGTAVMELAPLWRRLICVSFFGCGPYDQIDKIHFWQDMVSQHSVMVSCARKRKPGTLTKLAAGFSDHLSDYVDTHWYVRHEPAARQISALVRRHIAEDGWKEYIRDTVTYRRFNNLRGELTLNKHCLVEQLGWTSTLPFDECVLVWHVATDLCALHHHTNTSAEFACNISRRNSEISSNHMIYLLVIFPEMLMLGTRQDLHMIARSEIELIIKDESSMEDERNIARRIMDEQGDGDLIKRRAPMISKAHTLAKFLIGLDDQDKMWEVIQGVWVEMLCYSASRCRGYDHVNSLAYGGEFLTNVWLLWSFMGMETLSDKLNMPDPLSGTSLDIESAA